MNNEPIDLGGSRWPTLPVADIFLTKFPSERIDLAKRKLKENLSIVFANDCECCDLNDVNV
jgi:hypothetical protein